MVGSAPILVYAPLVLNIVLENYTAVLYFGSKTKNILSGGRRSPSVPVTPNFIVPICEMNKVGFSVF